MSGEQSGPHGVGEHMPVGDWQHLCKVASTRCSVANYFMKFSLALLGFNVIGLVYVDECLYEVLLISLYW